jgi:hypothetical protein
MTATSITTDNEAIVEIARGQSWIAETREKMLLAQIFAATTATNRVRNPMRIKKPATLIRETPARTKSPSHA